MNITKNILYLASSSRSRYELLSQAGFNIIVIQQLYNERSCEWSLPIEQLVLHIAQEKMKHVIMPTKSSESCYVLTADTLCADYEGIIYGKPESINHAHEMLRKLKNGSRVVTAFCLEKRSFYNGSWQTDKRVSDVVVGECFFDIPEDEIDYYCTSVPVLSCAGALSVDGPGALYLKKIIGSYSAIIGIPLCELRQALCKLGFF